MAQRPGITVSPRFNGFIILFMFLTMNAFYAHADIECKFRFGDIMSALAIISGGVFAGVFIGKFARYVEEIGRAHV